MIMHGFNFIAAIQWLQLLGSSPVEILATFCAVASVILIARQKVLGWPLGIVWAALSAWLAITQWQLMSDGILYLAYIPIQIYCWITWSRIDPRSEIALQPAWMSRKGQLILLVAAAGAIAVWALGISALASSVSWIPEPTLLWRDSTTTVLNFFAQFLQARKRMENWVGWLIVNALGIHIYWVKDAPIYSIQYAFFLGLGIFGWLQWNKSRRQAALQKGVQ